MIFTDEADMGKAHEIFKPAIDWMILDAPNEADAILVNAVQTRPKSRYAPYTPHVLFGIKCVIIGLEMSHTPETTELSDRLSLARKIADFSIRKVGFGPEEIFKNFNQRHADNFTDPLLTDESHAAYCLPNYVFAPFGEIGRVVGGAKDCLYRQGITDPLKTKEILKASKSLCSIARVPTANSNDLFSLIGAGPEYFTNHSSYSIDEAHGRVRFLPELRRRVDSMRGGVGTGCIALEIASQSSGNLVLDYWEKIVDALIPVPNPVISEVN